MFAIVLRFKAHLFQNVGGDFVMFKKKFLKTFGKEKKPKELLVSDEGEFLDWMIKEINEYSNEKVSIDRAVLKSVARRSIAVKILRFLCEHPDRDFSCTEIFGSVDIPFTTTGYWLRKLAKASILVRITPIAIDKRNKLYRVKNLELTKKIVGLHDRFVSFKLANILPFNKVVSIEELKKDTDFLELCKKYRLTANEGVEALKANRKIESVYCSRKDSNELIALKR